MSITTRVRNSEFTPLSAGLKYGGMNAKAMTIYLLSEQGDERQYIAGETSAASPMLTATLLTEMLEQMRREGELSALLAFDEWLQSRK